MEKSGKLFIAEDEDEEMMDQVEQAIDGEGDVDMSSTQRIKSEPNEHQNILHKVKVDGTDFMGSHEKGATDAKENMEIDGSGEDSDDPVIREIPINLVGRGENIHILQFASKPRFIGRRLAEHPVIAVARHKHKASIWEVDIPLDDQAFYNKDKAERKWDGVKFQTLRGIGIKNTDNYAAFLADGQVYLVPIQTISQLRPYFKYIDKIDEEKKEEDMKQNTRAAAASQKAQVVTMSVKSANDQSQQRLTGSLLAHKVAGEEAATELPWIENTFEQFRDALVKEATEQELEPVETSAEYLSKLL